MCVVSLKLLIKLFAPTTVHLHSDNLYYYVYSQAPTRVVVKPEPYYLKDVHGHEADKQYKTAQSVSCVICYTALSYSVLFHDQHLPFVLFQRSNVPSFKLPVKILTSLVLFVRHSHLGINTLTIFDSSVMGIFKIWAVLA